MMESRPHRIAEDKSRFTHGAVYHALFDRPLAEARRFVVDLVPEGSAVLDIACGTGELCFELAARKHCRVVGVDLSRRMIAFAQKRNRPDTVRFVHGDGTDLADLELGAFDYATVLFLLHEVPRETQVEVLNEALRVARKGDRGRFAGSSAQEPSRYCFARRGGIGRAGALRPLR